MLRDRHTLLILDDAASADQVRSLLPPSGSAALVTARHALDLPTVHDLDLAPLPPKAARALLAQLLPHLDVGPLVEACGGLPMVLHLARSTLAAQRDLAPADYLERLHEAQAQWPPVEAALSVGLSLESEERQAQWRALTLLHGFDVPAAAAAWQVEPAAAKAILDELLERGLIELSPIAPQDNVRYQVHDTLRAFALAYQDEAERARVQQQIATHYLEVLRAAAAACKQNVTLRTGLALLDLEWDNVRAGQAWAGQALGQSRQAGQLCSAYADMGGRCLDRRAPLKTQIRWLYDALRAAREWVKPEAEIRHLGRLAAAYQCQGKIEQAIAHYRQALSVAQQVNNLPAQSEHLGNLGLLYTAQGDNERAFGYFRQALNIAHAMGDRESEGNWLGNLGSAYRALGEIEQALRCHSQALEIARERGDPRSEAIWLGNLGNSHMAMGEPRQAIRAYRQAIEVATQVGDRQQQANLWGNLGNAYCAQNEAHEALAAYESALQIARELEDQDSEGIWLLNKCLILDQQGQRAEAIACAESARDALCQAGSPEASTAEALLERWS
jgi:tetratricopeptide (TPR) repeat protein